MAQYLPVLLVSVSAVSAPDLTPDDSVLDAQAINQVDYLSHQWQEEDIAKSWRNMTRRKDYIQNGPRLENASWRTWWKKRNNLPTVSPETLNWLKDSDVTWLYGPLHTAADWAPSNRHSTTPDNSIRISFSTETTPSSTFTRNNRLASRSNSPWALKPILKHRSISELLSVPFPSPYSEQMELEEDPYFKRSSSFGTIHGGHIANTDQSTLDRKRPKLIHARSDTNIHRRNPFRGDSPPLPLIPEDPPFLPTSVDPRESHEGHESQDSSCSDSNGTSQTPHKKRITFNTFVEQYIAIEKPKKLRDGCYVDEMEQEVFDDEGYGEDDEGSNNDDSDEDDVLEMKLGTHTRESHRRRLSSTSSSNASYGVVYDPPSDREHVTIAPIAPTVLKTSVAPSPASLSRGLWEEDVEIEDVECLFAGMPSPSSSTLNMNMAQPDDDVNLVFAPPQGSVYAERLAMNGSVAPSLNGTAAAAALVRVLGTSPTQMSNPIRAPFFPDDDEDEVLYDRRSKTPTANSPPFNGAFPRDPPPPSQDTVNGGSLTRAAILKNSSSDTRSSEMDVRSNGSKGSGSTSEDGTVVPQTLPVGPSSPTNMTIRVSPSKPMKSIMEDRDSPSPVRSSIRTARAQFHVHQAPSPARSTTSTSTSTTTTSNGSTSGASYGSPFLEPPSRGRSTSPVTSASPSRDGSRGRSNSIGKRNGSSISISDERDREREPPRGRSRSRSIGGGSPLEGSVSPRSESRSRLANSRGSRDSLTGYNGGTTSLGSFGSPVWREASLSPEEYDGRRGGRTSRGRRIGSGLVERERSSSGGDGSSLSPPPHPSPSGSLVKERVSRVPTKALGGVSAASETPNGSAISSPLASAKTIHLPIVPESPISPSSPPPPPPPPSSSSAPVRSETALVPKAPSKPIDIPAPSSQSTMSKNMLAAPAHVPSPLPDLAVPITAPAIVEALNALPAAVLPSLIPLPPAPVNTASMSTPVSSNSTPTTPRAPNFEESALSRAMTSARGYLGSLWNSTNPGVAGDRQATVQHAR